MPSQRTVQPWMSRLLELLDDREWHSYGEVVSEASLVVPEEMAYRKAEYYREYHYRKRGLEPEPRKHGDREDTIRTGQRFIVSKTIDSLRNRKKVEVMYVNEDGGSARKRPSQIRYIG